MNNVVFNISQFTFANFYDLKSISIKNFHNLLDMLNIN